MKEVMLLGLALLMVGCCLVGCLGVAMPGGVLHAGVVHVSTERGVVICAPDDGECAGNPFGYPVPGE